MPIQCTTKLYTIGTQTILRLPHAASAQLPSRGLVMVQGSINNAPFLSAPEPDDMGSHWFSLDASPPDTCYT